MPSYRGGKIIIFVSDGSSFDVSISTPVDVYDKFTRGGEPVTFPVTIDSTSEFDTEYDGEYTLSIKQNGVECATNLGNAAVVPLHFGSQFSVTPSTTQAQPVVPATFEPAPQVEAVAADGAPLPEGEVLPAPGLEPVHDPSIPTTSGPTLS